MSVAVISSYYTEQPQCWQLLCGLQGLRYQATQPIHYNCDVWHYYMMCDMMHVGRMWHCIHALYVKHCCVMHVAGQRHSPAKGVKSMCCEIPSGAGPTEFASSWHFTSVPSTLVWIVVSEERQHDNTSCNTGQTDDWWIVHHRFQFQWRTMTYNNIQ